MGNERYISIRDMLCYALRRWRNIIAMGWIGAVALGLFGGIKALIGEKQAMELPAIVTVAISELVKFALLGFAAAVFAGVALYAFCYVFSDQVYSATTIQIRNNVRVLGVLPRKKPRKKDRVISWIDKWEKRAVRNDVEFVRQLASDIHAHCGGSQTLLITGCAGIDKLNQVAAILRGTTKNLNILVSEKLADNPDALEISEAVLLVEACGESLYRAVEEECGRVAGLGKNLIGCVLFE